MVKFQLRKHISFLIVIGLLLAMFIPIGVYAISKTSPYLNLLPALENPETMQLDSMEVVNREYPFTVEKQTSLDSTRINMTNSIWDIKGIYLEEEYPFEERTNYYSVLGTTKVTDQLIDLGENSLPNSTYDEHQQSTVFEEILGDSYIVSQSEDDAWTTNLGTNYTSQTLPLGGHRSDFIDYKKRACIRWSLPIPKNAIIQNVYINLTVAGSTGYNGFGTDIYAFEDTSLAPFSDTNENIYETRPRISDPLIPWNLPSSISANETIQTPDLTDLLQAIISSNEWTSNSILGLYIDPRRFVQSNEVIEFWSLDAGNITHTPKLVIDWENPVNLPYTPKGGVAYRQRLSTDNEIKKVIGVWNTSDHAYPNGYNESEGDSFTGNTITLIPPISQTADLWITYISEQTHVVVEYYYKPWNSVIWQLGLKVTNSQPDPITVPKANFSLNYLGGKLGYGWISQDHNVLGGEVKTIYAFLETKNSKFFSAFTAAMLTGHPLELKADFEAYIFIDGMLGEPLMGVEFPTKLDFPFPESEGGMPPFIWLINRSEVIADQPVTVNVNATDEGTGISNRTYLYYSTNDGVSWNKVQMTGGEWLKIQTILGVPDYGLLPDYFPFPSTEQEQTYMAQIPGFPGGTDVLFKIYLEDYAGNIDHNNTGNWIESEVYSYQVPTTGSVPESLQQFNKTTERSFFNEFLDYLEANGVNQFNFLFTKGINALISGLFLGYMGEFLYRNDVDAHYTIPMLIYDYEKAASILADSGISVGNLIDIYGKSFEELGVPPLVGTKESNEIEDISFDILFDYLVDHIFLPTNEELPSLADQTLKDIGILDDFEGDVLANWVLDALGSITNFPGTLGNGIRWNTVTPENLIRNFGSEPISLTENDILTFYLNYNNYTRINENLSISLIDENGRAMDSDLLAFGNYIGFGEISLSLNSTDFTIDPDFDFDAVQKIQFSYHRDFPERRIQEVSVVSCSADESGDLNKTAFWVSSPDQTYKVWINMSVPPEDEPYLGFQELLPVNTIDPNDDNITVANKIKDAINAYGGDNPPFTATADQWNITITNTVPGDANLNIRDSNLNPPFGLFPTNFTFYTITDGRAEEVNIRIDHISEYTPSVYYLHRYFTLLLSNAKIQDFLLNDFQGINYQPTGDHQDPIIPTSDWDINATRTSLWNFLDLIATANDTNNHITGANLLLEDLESINSYNALLKILGGEITPLQETPPQEEAIYPYTQTVTTALVYLPLVLVTYKVVKNEVIKRGYIEKLKKSRKKR